MEGSNSWAMTALFSAACVTTAAVGFGAWLLKNKSVGIQNVRPEKWVQVGKVSRLVIYPIKSCQGIEVEEAVLTKLGLRFRNCNIRDRDFMLVDKDGKSRTQMQNPKMALISLKFGEQQEIILEAPGMPPMVLSCPEYLPSAERTCRVKHDKTIIALDCGDDAARWFQTYLGNDELRLYFHHINKSQRTFEPYMYKCPQFAKSDLGAFHNETAYLMVSEESITELNKRLEKKSSWRNWRPTILINDLLEPFAEVNWSFVRIGNEDAILKTAVPCYRCPITTVDPDKGTLAKDGEPLNTLRKMNLADYFADRGLAELLKNKGIMGLRLGLYLPSTEEKIVKAGDAVYAALL